MAGLYIHIPFCQKACHYCDFHFSTQLHSLTDMVDCLLLEMEYWKSSWNPERLDSIYFGGGTPSLLSAEQIALLINKAVEIWPLVDGAEITLEANPDDVSENKVRGWQEAGINRISLGVQSFFQADLLWMNRSHTSAQAFSALEILRSCGIENITIDLIYGLPNQESLLWKKNLKHFLGLGIPHLSAYSLTIEEKTVFGHQLKAGSFLQAEDESVERDYIYLCETLENHGYGHYEISNFSLPGKEAKHNSAYWGGQSYLGIGPSAHSFYQDRRWWNLSNNIMYISKIRKNEPWWEGEILTSTQRRNERLITSLRTSKGIQTADLFEGVKGDRSFIKELNSLIEQTKLVENSGVWRIPEKHWLVSDEIISRLIIG
jgi:oxygen-independent coproporphyrinogen III oxidase